MSRGSNKVNKAVRTGINRHVAAMGIRGNEWHAIRGTLLWAVEQVEVTLIEIAGMDAEALRELHRRLNA